MLPWGVPFVGSTFYVIDAEWRKGNKRVPVAGDRKMVHLERREEHKELENFLKFFMPFVVSSTRNSADFLAS
jgi:hypothetical protein